MVASVERGERDFSEFRADPQKLEYAQDVKMVEDLRKRGMHRPAALAATRLFSGFGKEVFKDGEKVERVHHATNLAISVFLEDAFSKRERGRYPNLKESIPSLASAVNTLLKYGPMTLTGDDAELRAQTYGASMKQIDEILTLLMAVQPFMESAAHERLVAALNRIHRTYTGSDSGVEVPAQKHAKLFAGWKNDYQKDPSAYDLRSFQELGRMLYIALEDHSVHLLNP